MQPNGSEISAAPVLSLAESLTRARLSTCSRRTSMASLSVIFSRALADGRSLRVSRAGRTIALYGPARARASRLASPGKARANRTPATSGRNCSALLPQYAPPSLWESKLRQRLASLGSTECILTWKASATPAGRPLSRLVPSTRPTDAIDCGLWPTMTCSAQNTRSESAETRIRGEGMPLADTARAATAQALWQTMVQDDAMDRSGGKVNSRGEPKLSAQAIQTATAALWPTCTSLAPARNGQNEAGNSAGLVAIREHALASLATPTSRDHRSCLASPETHERNSRPLSEQVGAPAGLTTWPTPMTMNSTSHKAKYGRSTSGPSRGGARWGLQDIAETFGSTPTSSTAQTEKPGALAPIFVGYLMGFCPEWLDCAPTSMPRQSRR